MTAAARAAAEAAARASYGRLVAMLASRTRDVAAAEDALAEAFRAALEHWPGAGVPARPEAWLLVAARRRLDDAARHGRVRAAAAPTLRVLAEAAEAAMDGDDDAWLPDRRLGLLFACAHPAIDAAARTPLMLQTVLGLDAARIAAAYALAPAAMGQRLVRAKAKIRDAGIAFAVPGREALAARLDAVLEAVYAGYGTGWEEVAGAVAGAGADVRAAGLAEEAIWLGRLLAGLLPEEPETRGLLALMLFCESRRLARRGPDGAYVPLSAQDPARWSRPLIDEAEALLTAAHAAGRIGRFQIEAAIQSAHAARVRGVPVDWGAVVALYDALVARAPGIGALVGRAAAVVRHAGPAAGLAALDAAAVPPGYQPGQALRAHLLAALGHSGEARAAFAQAAELADDPAVRRFLLDEEARQSRS